jgi:hypothetical protein
MWTKVLMFGDTFPKGFNEVRKTIKYVKMSFITCDIVFCLIYIFPPFKKKSKGTGVAEPKIFSAFPKGM